MDAVDGSWEGSTHMDVWMEAHTPVHIPCYMHLSCLAGPELYPLQNNCNHKTSVFLSSVSLF